MVRIPSQFDQRAQATPAAAGGGTTCSTCSCCVVTLGVAALTPVLLFRSLATTAPGSDGSATSRMSPGSATALGFAVPLAWVLLACIALADFGVAPIAGLMALATWVGSFAYAYERTQGRPGWGICVAILCLVGFTVMALGEIAVWLK